MKRREAHRPLDLAFPDYSALIAELTRLGTGYDRSMRLENRSSNLLIGEWGRNRAGVIVPKGEISLDIVSTTPVGTAASVAGAVVTVSGGHSLATREKVLRVWNVTDAALVADVAAGSWSVAGNDVTVPAVTATALAALLGAGKVVRLWVEGVSEFSIGGASDNVQVVSGEARFAVGLLVANGRARAWLGAGRRPVLCTVTLARSAAADGQYAGAGYGWGASKSVVPIIRRVSGAAALRVAIGNPASPTLLGAGDGLYGVPAAFEGSVDLVPTEYQVVANEITCQSIRGGAIEAFCYATGGGAYAAAVPDSIVVHAIPAAAETVSCLLTVARML